MKDPRFCFARPRLARSAGAASFTLVEMLVALAVFTILMLLFSELVISATHTAFSENAKLAALSDARGALDRFGRDWSARVRRSDVGMTATANSITFLTQVPSYSGTRRLTSVSYRMGTNYILQRGILGYNWLSTDPAPDGNPTLAFPPAGANGNPTLLYPATLVSADYDNLANDVFHMAISFLVPSSTNAPSGFSSDTSMASSTNLVGVVVTLAALDPRNRLLISNNQLTNIASTLDAGVTNGCSTLAIWQDAVNSSNFSTSAGVPGQVGAAVRVYQRVFYTQE